MNLFGKVPMIAYFQHQLMHRLDKLKVKASQNVFHIKFFEEKLKHKGAGKIHMEANQVTRML